MTTKGERTKQHILQQAIHLFSKNSFKNVTIRQIAKEAQVSPGLIYKYFETQEDIYYAAMQYASHDLLERLQNIETLEKFVEQYLYHMFTSEVLFEIMTYFSLDQDHSKNFLPILNEINQF
ncbi:MAG: TetR/AcrR family transcriptional regulator, partial [Lysinibacillus sp.]